MGLYPPRLSGGGHDSDSLRVQGVWSVAEEKEQSAPTDRRRVGAKDGGDHQVSFGERKGVAVQRIAAVCENVHYLLT